MPCALVKEGLAAVKPDVPECVPHHTGVSDLIGWLRKVVDSVVAVVETSSLAEAYEPDGRLSFTEPNLSLAVSACDGPQVEVLVGLSHECALPPIGKQRCMRVHD